MQDVQGQVEQLARVVAGAIIVLDSYVDEGVETRSDLTIVELLEALMKGLVDLIRAQNPTVYH